VDNWHFYCLVVTFILLVLIMPMMPVVLFVVSDRQPSVSPDVFRYLHTSAINHNNQVSAFGDMDRDVRANVRGP